MYINNGIAYADENKALLKIISIRSIEQYKLWVKFNTEEERILDFKPLLDKLAFKPLKNQELFNTVYLDYGIPVWNNGEIDISPDYIYENGVIVQ